MLQRFNYLPGMFSSAALARPEIAPEFNYPVGDLAAGLSAAAQAIARILALLGLEAAYFPYIPGLTQPFVGTTNASSWPDSSGKVRPMLQATGAAQMTINPDGSLQGNGSTTFMAAVFTLIQPCAVISCLQETTWINGGRIHDGGTAAGTMLLYETGITPSLSIFAGTQLTPASSPPVGTTFVGAAVYDGANSSIQFDAGPVTTGNAGTANPGGITIGAQQGGSNPSNTKFCGEIVLSGHPSQPVILQAIADLTTLRLAAGIT